MTRLTAVRETGASLAASWGFNRGLPETHRASQHYRIGIFEGALNWSPIMPRAACLSDNKFKFFKSGIEMENDLNSVMESILDEKTVRLTIKLKLFYLESTLNSTLLIL